MSSEKSGIRDRVVEFIVHITNASTSRYKEMERHTGISSEKWQNVAAKKQRVTEDMLERIGSQWPQYAYWLMTGKRDYDNHIDPGYDRWTRHSTSTPIILARDRAANQFSTAPIDHKIKLGSEPVEFDWGAVTPGTIELAANILHYCGLAELASAALASSYAEEVLSKRGENTLIYSAEVKEWIKTKTGEV